MQKEDDCLALLASLKWELERERTRASANQHDFQASKTYCRANVHFDHNPLICSIEVKMRHTKKERPNNIKIIVKEGS